MESRKLLTGATMTSNIQANSENGAAASAQVLLERKGVLVAPGNKNIMRRTRNALGDIGNRLTQKGGAAGAGANKPAAKEQPEKKETAASVTLVNKPAAKPTLHKSVTFRTGSSSHLSSATTSGAAGVKPKLFRHNSVAVGGSSSSATISTAAGGFKLPALKPRTAKPQLLRSHVPSFRTNSGLVSQREKARLVDVPPSSSSSSEIVVAAVKPKEGGQQGQGDDKVIDELAEAFSLQRFSQEIPDIDAEDSGASQATEYVKDISNYLFVLERQHIIRDKFLCGRFINARMRAVLVDWLVEVHGQFNYQQETLYMTVKTMDRFLQNENDITRTQLQLVGMTAMFLSAKYEEVISPNVHDYTSVSDGAFCVDELRRMEERMLKSLNFDLSAPQPIFFLRRCSKAAKADIKLYTLAKYVMEITILDYEFSHFLPSKVAAGAYALAAMIVENESLAGIWTPTQAFYTRYSMRELKPILRMLGDSLSRICDDAAKQQAIHNKYSRGRLLRVSRLPEVLAVTTWKPKLMKNLELIK